MKTKYISGLLILVFCSTALLGQEGITEGSSIVINKGNVRENQSDIHLNFPVLDGEKIFNTTDQKIVIAGKIDNHEDLENLVIQNKRVSLSSLNEYGYFEDSIDLKPGAQEITMRAYFSDTQIEESFIIEYVTPMMEWEREAISESTNHALIIGINEYSDSKNFPTLYRPVKDAKEMFHVLTTKYTFEINNTKLLEDPTKNLILSEFDNLMDRVKPNDNVLIYFAGHGEWNEVSGNGFWIPSDAVSGRNSTYFSNDRLVTFIEDIHAKHTLVIADACVAGALFNTRSAIKDSDQDIREKYRVPSCKAMTSASFKETNDNSAFAKFLIEELSENDESAISALKLYGKLYDSVKDNGGSPQYGTIRSGSDRNGEFVFFQKQD